MKMLLLLSAVVLLVSPAPQSLNVNLKRIINLVENGSLYTEQQKVFVHDVRRIPGQCTSTYFCKVYDILRHLVGHKGKKEKELERHLGVFNNRANCTELLQDLPSPGINITVSDVLTNLPSCCRNWNLNH